MGKWIKKVLETPIETKGNIIDALGGTKDERTNAPSIRAVKEDVFNLIYPVGSIYMSVNNVSPATLFGGEWESLENRFLVGAGSGYSAGSKGGSDSADITHTHNMGHTHTMAHTHSMNHTHPFNLPDHQQQQTADSLKEQGYTTPQGYPQELLSMARCGHGFLQDIHGFF